VASYLQDDRHADVAFQGAATPKKTQVPEFGWPAEPDNGNCGTASASQAENVQTAYTTFRSASFVTRADYFTVQDGPEGNVFTDVFRGTGRHTNGHSRRTRSGPRTNVIRESG
jgi:hypothetical protein